MKKPYMKPKIVFESFSMSTSIAAGCDTIIDAPSAGTCGFEYEGGYGQTIFTKQAGTDVCQLGVEDGNNGYCYHTPTEDSFNLFNS